ncbi:hypothetical protein C4565_08975 [Candidatus Parcubacteria bacterium]|nr:MAG: hypothetical protein C4565_08975 [Candidatus Parcubacteria bacterium]
MQGLLKCEVCGKITMIKIGVSFSSTTHQIFIPCKNCDTLFFGFYNQNDETVEIKTTFINAEDVSSEKIKPDYICTISRDFLSQKIFDYEKPEDTITFPEWMKFKNRIGDECYRQLFNNVEALNNSASQAIHEYTRVMNLWFNSNFDLLASQLAYFLDADKNNIPLKTEQNYLSAIRRLTISLTKDAFFGDEFDDFMEESKNFISTLYTTRPEEIKRYLEKLEELDLFKRIEKLIFDRIKAFYVYVPDLTPVFSLLYLSENERKLLFEPLCTFGTFTTSFEHIKPFYIDNFETIIKTLTLPLGLNNILKRGDFNIFGDPSISDLVVFNNIEISYNKMKHIESGSFLTSEIDGILDNKLRNSIGHCDYQVNNLTQTISYNKSRTSIALSSVGYSTYKQFLYLLKTFYITTLLHEAYYEFRAKA